MEIENLIVEKYEWGNKILTVRENKVIHKKLQSDPNFASRYFTKFVGPANAEEEKSKISSDEEIYEDLVWSHDAVKLLVSEYKKRLHRFNNPEIRNSLLWNEIAEVFKKKNKPYPVRSISRKFGNMKTTYYKVLKNKPRVKVGRKPWPWTKAMEEILGNDNSFTDNKITSANKNNNDNVNSIRVNSKSSNHDTTGSVESANNISNEENLRKDDYDKDNWDMIDDTSNLSSSLGISSERDCISSSSRSSSKDISEYRKKMLDLKTEEVGILKLIHKNVDDVYYSRLEVVSELTVAIKEHTVVLKEFADVLKERFLDK